MFSLAQVLSFSPFLQSHETSIRTELRSVDFASELSVLLQDCPNEDELQHRLRVYRNQEMANIAYGDLSGQVDLPTTLANLSALADALIQQSLAYLEPLYEKRFGQPLSREGERHQKLIVLGMGKLGARELNFSSDIDLIFIYPEDGNTEGALRSFANKEFFIRLGQALIKALNPTTKDGFVFRVDMRLRPFGNSGPLAISFNALNQYFQVHGRAWERYAMIKARPMTGDAEQIQRLQNEIINPFVYRRFVDFSVVEEMRSLKSQIVKKVKQQGMERNIKLGDGGIREIEFFAQVLQLIHGGRDRALQVREMKNAYELLSERELVSADEKQGLLKAYDFLRLVENRLQMWKDEQTHDLPPENSEQYGLLAESMGFETVEAFTSQLNEHNAFVSKLFVELLGEQAAQGDESWTELEHFEYLTQTKNFKWMDAEGRKRLDQFMTRLQDWVESSEVSVERAQTLLPVIESVMRRSAYLVMLNENPGAVKALLELCGESPWIAAQFSQYPSLMDVLLDVRNLSSPMSKSELQAQVAAQLDVIPTEHFEKKMLVCRQFKSQQVMKVAAGDILAHIPVMKVSDYLTWIAEAMLEESIKACAQPLIEKHGSPAKTGEDLPFIIVAYGKLGGIELGYGSDLDIVMLFDEQRVNPETGGEKSITAQEFFLKLGRQLVQFLTAQTIAGPLYEVDSRLRPNGRSGTLVVSLEAFDKYQRNEAWTWEHQALLRSRAVAGSESVCERYEGLRQQLLVDAVKRDTLKDEVVKMREKMRANLDKSTADVFDMKQGSGGIVDIEFIVQYLCLSHAADQGAHIKVSDNMRLIDGLMAAGWIDHQSGETLQEAYQVYRDQYHHSALQSEKALYPIEKFAQLRERVCTIWRSIMA